MGRGNSNIIFFLEQHEQEIINCCKKGMSNNEVISLLKQKYNREVPSSTYRKFKAELKIKKNDFLQTLIDEIQNMKNAGATDQSITRWLKDEHYIEVSRSTFGRFKKKFNLTDNDKDPREADKKALTNRAIAQKQIIDNDTHSDNIYESFDTIIQQQITDIRTGLTNIDIIIQNGIGIEIDFEKLEREIRRYANEKNLPRYLIDLTELKVRYLELTIKAFTAKNALFKDEIDTILKNRIIEMEDKRIEMSQKDIMNEIEILSKQIDENNV